MSDHHVHHAFDYIEIPTPDIDRSEVFYREAFGWTLNPFGPEYLGIVTGDGHHAGGLSQTSGFDARRGPVVVVYSNDLETSRDAVIAAGGVITRQIFEFSGGRRFHFTDPNGHEFGVWSDLPPT